MTTDPAFSTMKIVKLNKTSQHNEVLISCK
jgi:hypothetical protein